MATNRTLFIAYMVCVIVSGRVASKPSIFPEFIAFGDSHLDPGNNNYINTIAKCDFPPYGREFEGGNPTGRFSDGKILPDLIAEAVGIKQLVPPYLDPSLQINDLLTGVSFASGGSGYDLVAGSAEFDRARLLEEYKEKLKASVGENATDSIISDTLYLISSGSNDITNTYLLRRLTYHIDSYSDILVGFASTSRCLPVERTLAGGLNRECVEEYNRLASIFNSKLKDAIQHLNNILPGSNLLYLDFYGVLLDLINHPANEGRLVLLG